MQDFYGVVELEKEDARELMRIIREANTIEDSIGKWTPIIKNVTRL
jgi:hypothetical protein